MLRILTILQLYSNECWQKLAFWPEIRKMENMGLFDFISFKIELIVKILPTKLLRKESMWWHIKWWNYRYVVLKEGLFSIHYNLTPSSSQTHLLWLHHFWSLPNSWQGPCATKFYLCCQLIIGQYGPCYYILFRQVS